jgi:hypothetical protein
VGLDDTSLSILVDSFHASRPGRSLRSPMTISIAFP